MKRLGALSAALVLSACHSTPEVASSVVALPPSPRILPDAGEPFRPDGAFAVQRLLEEYAASSGQRFDDHSADRAERVLTWLGPEQVAAADVPDLVEAALALVGCALEPQAGFWSIRLTWKDAQALEVSPEAVLDYDDHPALLVRTVFSLPGAALDWERVLEPLFKGLIVERPNDDVLVVRGPASRVSSAAALVLGRERRGWLELASPRAAWSIGPQQTLHEALASYSRASGQAFLFDPDSAPELAERLPLVEPLELGPEGAASVLEDFLSQNELFLRGLRTRPTSIVSVGSARYDLRRDARVIGPSVGLDAQQRERLRQRSGTLVVTTVACPPGQADDLRTQFRPLMGGLRTRGLLAFGADTLVLAGPGKRVVAELELLDSL